MWPFTKKQPEVAPAPPKPTPTPLELWAREIAEAEFPGVADNVDMLYGIHEVRATLRAEHGTWLAEVGQDRQTALMFRMRRDLK